MNRRGTRRAGMALAIVAMVALVAGCGDGGRFEELTVAQVRVGAPTGPNAGLYFMARGYEEADALIAASTEAAASAELHETVQGDDGTMSMQMVPRFELPAEGELVLAPGGLHIMLLDVDDLAVGDTIEVVLTWENFGEMTVEAEVVDPADTMADHETGDH